MSAASPLDRGAEEALIALVREVARREILPRFRRLPAGAVRSKTQPDDLVTDADLASEEALTTGARQILPGAEIIGEEAVAADPSVLNGLADAELAVVIDPIDGTWNYANGLAVFGVLLAVVARGQTVFGLLYDPVMDDWIAARRGGGCWFAAADGAVRPVSVSRTAALSDTVGFIPHHMFEPSWRPRLSAGYFQHARVTSLRCSCHEYRMLTQGHVDFVLNAGLAVWDHAAGVLALEEAGGVAQLLTGEAYAPSLRSGNLLSTNTPEMLAALHGLYAGP